MSRYWSSVLFVLAGCAAQPDRSPSAPPAPVLCAVPEGMTDRDPEPQKPRGDYSQKDVSLFIEGLHRWGTSSAARLGAIERWTAGCRERARKRREAAGGEDGD